MDEDVVRTLVSTVELINSTLDAAQESWRDHLPAIRNITASLEFSDTSPDGARRAWQVSLITVFQRVAYADADSGGVPDVANWCLRQSLTLLQVYQEDVEILALIGRNWLLRAQRSLAKIHQTERSSSSSGGSQEPALSSSEEQRQAATATVEAESRLHTSDYVEARGILLPAVEYLERAVEEAREQDMISGPLLATAAEAFMSLGNVSSVRVSDQYFQEALSCLRAASEVSDYSLPFHLQQYLDEYGLLDSTA